MTNQQKILVVEDDTLLRDVLADKLAKNGFEALRAEDGIVALEVMGKTRPDLVLLDVLMPRKGGMEVLEDMSRDALLKDIPVIIISNSGQPVEMERARTLGARDFLIKAVFDPNEVLDKVRRVLEHPDVQQDWVVRSQNVSGVGAVSLSTNTKPMSEQQKPSVTNKIVLVVEDDKFLRELLVKKLTKEGFQVEAALDGETGVALLGQKTPDIILLDLLLPKMDGFEVLTRVRQDAKTKATPVIIFSNLGEKADIDKAMSLGATDFMVKANFTLDEIVTKMQGVLQ